jgi:hypothetical protein
MIICLANYAQLRVLSSKYKIEPHDASSVVWLVEGVVRLAIFIVRMNAKFSQKTFDQSV